MNKCHSRDKKDWDKSSVKLDAKSKMIFTEMKRAKQIFRVLAHYMKLNLWHALLPIIVWIKTFCYVEVITVQRKWAFQPIGTG